MPETPSPGDRPDDFRGDQLGGVRSEAPSSRRAAREAQRGVAPDASDAQTSVPGEDGVGRPAAAVPAASAPAPRPRTPERSIASTTAPIDALFEENGLRAPSSSSKRHDKDRRKSRVAAWGVFAIVLVIIGGLVGGGVAVWNTYEDQIRKVMGWEEPKDFEAGMAEGEASVTVLSGQTGADISRTLFDAGVTKTSGAFYSYLIDSAEDTSALKPGVYSLQKKMTSEAAYQALLDPENRQEYTAQLREGLTVAQSVPRIAEGIGLPLKDVEAAVEDPSVYGVKAESLEGWLFPATYTFDPDVTAKDVIQRMVDRTVQALDKVGVPADQRERILTVASIIEKEARSADDFYKVSRVIENRLDPAISDTNGLLQMDSTAQYPFQDREGGASSRAEELEDDNGWNTYKKKGLPVTPIANPGELAMKAALEPADGPWQYFVTVNLQTGETVFSATFAEHEKAVTQYQQWCRDNPDGGCS
ncbi:endolytic transglycosylase MltG [Microbacterium sp. NPDC091382]|uniref:endolytic transglycosylase MltG n=1 Tax=Microbacterium sp. NPDC091382 TaxID=3364210 RepID=UPI0037F5C110